MNSEQSEPTEDERRRSDSAEAERNRISEIDAAEHVRKESNAEAERVRLRDHDDAEVRRREDRKG
jgi:hypothetical protein